MFDLLCVPGDFAVQYIENTRGNTMQNTFMKSDWDRVREEYARWWRGDGLILHITAPRAGQTHSEKWDGVDTASAPDLETAWLDPDRRIRMAEHFLENTYLGGEAYPYFDTHIGPGSLAIFLGCEPTLAVDTVWYRPSITDPDTYTLPQFDPNDRWVQIHADLMRAAMAASGGRYLVSLPDLIENIDVLSQLRDPQTLMYDLIERPDWVGETIAQINDAFFAAFDYFYDIVRDPWGGSCFAFFKIWGPGKTAKVQCDAAALISPAMFQQFVAPSLTAQCAWLDYSMYHLDGTQAMIHLNNLLAIEPLNAIEWTPQSGKPGGGSPEWYDLYRRILAGGKSVQAIGVEYDEVIPLLDAVGGKGMHIWTTAADEDSARRLEERVAAYRA
jgi:hypothetical protein